MASSWPIGLYASVCLSGCRCVDLVELSKVGGSHRAGSPEADRLQRAG